MSQKEYLRATAQHARNRAEYLREQARHTDDIATKTKIEADADYQEELAKHYDYAADETEE